MVYECCFWNPFLLLHYFFHFDMCVPVYLYSYLCTRERGFKCNAEKIQFNWRNNRNWKPLEALAESLLLCICYVHILFWFFKEQNSIFFSLRRNRANCFMHTLQFNNNKWTLFPSFNIQRGRAIGKLAIFVDYSILIIVMHGITFGMLKIHCAR